MGEGFFDIGLYSRAAAVCGLILLIPQTFGSMLYAKWASAVSNSKSKQLEMTIRAFLTYGYIMVLVVIIFGKTIISLLYGHAFLEAYQALAILAPAFIAIAMSGACYNFLSSDGRAGLTTFFLILSVFVSLIANFSLIPFMGIRGAALGTLLGNGLATVVCFGFCVRAYNLNYLKCLIITRADLEFISKSLGAR